MKTTNITGHKLKITHNTKQHVAENKTQVNPSLCLDDGHPLTTASCDLRVCHFNPFIYIDYASSACTAFFFF